MLEAVYAIGDILIAFGIVAGLIFVSWALGWLLAKSDRRSHDR